MHFTGYFKNLTLEDRERNYAEFVFRHAFKVILVRKKLWKVVMGLEQGELYEMDFYNKVYMKVYKVPMIKSSKVTLTGTIYDLNKTICYLFKLVKHDTNKFLLEVETASHLYKDEHYKYCYTDNSTEAIYAAFEKDELIWS